MFDKRIFNRYFIINLSVLLLFPSSLIFKNGFDFIKEGNLFLSLIVLFFAKYIRSYSIENFLIDFCFYAKILTFCFLVTINRGVSLWFLFACFGLIYMIIIDYSSKIFNIVLWLLLELPEYCGQSKMYELENSEDFQNFIQPKGSMKNYKIIEFYSPRTINCINVCSLLLFYLVSFNFLMINKDKKHLGRIFIKILL